MQSFFFNNYIIRGEIIMSEKKTSLEMAQEKLRKIETKSKLQGERDYIEMRKKEEKVPGYYELNAHTFINNEALKNATKQGDKEILDFLDESEHSDDYADVVKNQDDPTYVPDSTDEEAENFNINDVIEGGGDEIGDTDGDIMLNGITGVQIPYSVVKMPKDLVIKEVDPRTVNPIHIESKEEREAVFGKPVFSPDATSPYSVVAIDAVNGTDATKIGVILNDTHGKSKLIDTVDITGHVSDIGVEDTVKKLEDSFVKAFGIPREMIEDGETAISEAVVNGSSEVEVGRLPEQESWLQGIPEPLYDGPSDDKEEMLIKGSFNKADDYATSVGKYEPSHQITLHTKSDEQWSFGKNVKPTLTLNVMDVQIILPMNNTMEPMSKVFERGTDFFADLMEIDGVKEVLEKHGAKIVPL
jgi:hypothetical protein